MIAQTSLAVTKLPGPVLPLGLCFASLESHDIWRSIAKLAYTGLQYPNTISTLDLA